MLIYKSKLRLKCFNASPDKRFLSNYISVYVINLVSVLSNTSDFSYEFKLI